VLNPLSVKINPHNVVTKLGSPETIPTNIIIEIPFPIPLLVIWSPNHINSEVPPTSPTTTNAPVKKSVLTNIPALLYDKNNPIASTKAKIIVIILVYLSIFFLPSSPPSLVNLSKDGIIIANNCTTIDAVIYGVIDIANIENLEKAPPEIILINPATPSTELIASDNAILLTPGTVI